jgi:hypothetical protein
MDKESSNGLVALLRAGSGRGQRHSGQGHHLQDSKMREILHPKAKLPEGIASIVLEEHSDNMVGDILVITTASGVVIKVDRLSLAGSNEGSVGVYQEDRGETLNDTAYIFFGPDCDTEVGQK